MIPSGQLEEFVKGWEGCSLIPYQDRAGLWTVGYGHVLLPTDKRGVITQDQADALFNADILNISTKVGILIPELPLQQQFDAVLSLTYNIGIGAFRNSTLRMMLMSGDDDNAANQFTRWCKTTIDGGKVTVPGLLARRLAEKGMFQFGSYDARP